MDPLTRALLAQKSNKPSGPSLGQNLTGIIDKESEAYRNALQEKQRGARRKQSDAAWEAAVAALAVQAQKTVALNKDLAKRAAATGQKPAPASSSSAQPPPSASSSATQRQKARK